MTRRDFRFARRAAILSALTGVHLALGSLSDFGNIEPFRVSMLWLPAGLAVAAIMQLGRPAVLAVFVAALINNLQYDTSLGVVFAIAMGIALQGAVVTWLIGRWCRVGVWAAKGADPRFRWSLNQSEFPVFRYYGLIALGAMTAPTIGALILCGSGTASWAAFPTNWIAWWIGDTLGIAVLTPIVFAAWSRWKNATETFLWQQPLAMLLMPLGVIIFWMHMAVEFGLLVRLPGGMTNETFQIFVSVLAGAGLIIAGLLLLRAERLVLQLSSTSGDLTRVVSRLVSAQKASRMATWEWDIAARRMVNSADFLAQLEDEPGESVVDFAAVASRVHPEDRKAALRWLRQCMRAKQSGPHDLQCRMSSKTGAWIWLSVSGTMADRDSRGRPRRFIGASVDITRQKATEQDLRDSEEAFRQLTENIREVFWLVDVDRGSVLHVSDAYERLWGRSRDSLREDPASWLAAIHPEDRNRVLEARGARQVLGTYDETFRILRPDGTQRWIRDRAFPVRNAEGRIYRVAGIAEDITESRQNERDLQDARSELAAILNAAGEAIIAADIEGSICLANQAALKMWGWRSEELLGKPLSVLMPEGSRKAHLEGMSRYRRSRRSAMLGKRIELVGLRKSGEEFPMETFVSATEVASGTLFIAACRDLTETRRIEGQLRESQKLEAIGQLTGGLAHDFNNLLGVVVGNLDLMGERLPDDQGIRRTHRSALEAALRGAEVTRSLLAVARRQPLKVEVHDLNGLLVEMLPLVRSSVGAAVTVRSQLWPGELLARVDAAGLSNALLNLVINARDAMKAQAGDSRLLLQTRIERIAAGEDGQLSAGPYAVVEVEDSGPGMSEEVRLRAFEPFFTTKDVGKGTGLGLSMVLGFVEQLGGTARIKSAAGQGAKVCLYLPLEAMPVPAIARTDETGKLAGVSEDGQQMPGPLLSPARIVESGRMRVLVVDDEPALCELAREWFESLGCDVRCVHSGSQAVAALEQGEYELLFSDVIMPDGMDGLMLAGEVNRRWPKVKVLLASGYAKGLTEYQDLPWPLLNKPYRKADLAREIRSLVASE